jgi:hypothetical protein
MPEFRAETAFSGIPNHSPDKFPNPARNPRKTAVNVKFGHIYILKCPQFQIEMITE